MTDIHNAISISRTTAWVIFSIGWVLMLMAVYLSFVLGHEVGGLLMFPVAAIAIFWGWSMRANHVRAAQPNTRGSGTLAHGVSAGTANRGSLQNLSQSSIWEFTKRGALIGFLAGMLIKFLDTTVMMFAVDQHSGWLWLLFAGCLIGSAKEEKLVFVPLIVWVLAGLKGVQINILGILGALFSTCLVGAAFGIPLGMMIGTIVGYARHRSAQGAPEGSKPLIWGFAVPGAALLVLAWLYLGVFMPYAMRLIES